MQIATVHHRASPEPENLSEEYKESAPLKSDDSSSSPLPTTANPLAGLPALPKFHHSYGNCQVAETPAPSVPCPFPVDSNSPLMVDFARITHAWPIEIALGGGCCPGGMRRDDDGNTMQCTMDCVESAGATDIVSSAVAVIVAFAAAMFN